MVVNFLSKPNLLLYILGPSEDELAALNSRLSEVALAKVSTCGHSSYNLFCSGPDGSDQLLLSTDLFNCYVIVDCYLHCVSCPELL